MNPNTVMNQGKIEISVVVPLYNKKQSVLETMKSALNQKFDNYEIIVVDDGSTDHSAELVETIKDEKLKLYRKKNTGVSDTRNFGIDKAQGDYIAFLDADDLWDDLYLERLHRMIESAPECGMFAQNFKVVSKQNIESAPEQPEPAPIEIYPNWEEFFFQKTFRTSAIAVHKEKFLQSGGFDTSLTIGEDLEAWLRISLKYPVCYLDECHVQIIFYSKEYHSRIVPKDYTKHYTYKLTTQTDKYLHLKDNIFVRKLINRAVFYAYQNFSWDRNYQAARLLKKHLKFRLLNRKDKIKYILFQTGCLKYFVKRG